MSVKTRSWEVMLTIGSLTLGEVRCHALRRLQQTHGEVHMVRNWGLLPNIGIIAPAHDMWVKHLGSVSSDLSNL